MTLPISLVGIFLLTRFINLTNIPIFTDEAIYLRWAQIALADPRWRFISLIDGKQPLFIWILLPVLKIITDPLIAGRIVSIFAGLTAALILAILSLYKTKSYWGFITGFIFYLILPFFLVYDRLALYEALFLIFSISALCLSFILGRTLRFDVALLLGTVTGFGLLTKSYSNFFLLLYPLTLLLVNWKKGYKVKIFGKWLGLGLIVYMQSQIYENILRLSEFRYIIGQKNLSFIYSLKEFFVNPLRSVTGNLHGMLGWLIGYLTLPLFIYLLVSLIWFFTKNRKEGLFFLGWFGIPFIALAFFGKVIYPRFLLFMTPPLLIPGVVYTLFLCARFAERRIIVPIFLIISIPLIFFDYKLLTSPVTAPLPYADRQQLINDWPAGYGIKEVVTYIDSESRNGPVILATEGTFGLFPMAVELYLGKNVNVTVKAYWPLSDFPQELLQLARTKKVFLVFKEKQNIPVNWPIQLIQEYRRGDGPTYLKFYRVIANT